MPSRKQKQKAEKQKILYFLFLPQKFFNPWQNRIDFFLKILMAKVLIKKFFM